MTPGVIDVRMHGHPMTTAAYVVAGTRGTALIDTGPASSLEVTRDALARLGVHRLDWIVLTHVHLDHAGACGALAAEHADAQIAVHGRGAPHLIDPSRLWEGVCSIYGDRSSALWGPPQPVAAARVHVVEDGHVLDLGDRRLRAVETPGHAPHHHAWIEEVGGDAFVGDAVGMQVGTDELWRATTPPPQFDLDAALGSIERLRDARPHRIWLGHFGAATVGGDDEAVDAVFNRGAFTLRDWASAIRDRYAEKLRGAALTSAVREWLATRERSWPPSAAAALEGTSDPAVDVAGVVHWLERASVR